MPVGIITDVGVTVLGGILGCLLGSKLSASWKALLNNLLGVAAMVMGIVLILRVANLSAALLGKIIPCLALPQLGVYLVLFFASGLVSPFITDTMIADFSAVGGIITLVAGMRLGGIKRDIPVLNLLPGLILAFFFSAAWTAFVA